MQDEYFCKGTMAHVANWGKKIVVQLALQTKTH
jgi:hypothetical protein